MLCITATLTEAVFVYLCICICVFALQTLGNIVFGHILSENMWFVWFDISYSGQKVGCHKRDDKGRRATGCEHRARICEAGFATFDLFLVGAEQ